MALPTREGGAGKRASVRLSPAWTSLRFPRHSSLPPETWKRRHRGILVLLAAQAAGLVAFGVFMGKGVGHALLEGGVVALLALAAAFAPVGQRARSVLAGFGLMSCSAILTHLSGGYIEAHFHFFVMLGVIFLYEDWLPYVLAVGYVAVHHGVAGTLDPLSVYNHPDAIAHPWAWAGVHALFILGLSAALVVAWNALEQSRRNETSALQQAHDLKRQLNTQEKMAALGSLASGLAHEVRTPLTVVAVNAALIERQALHTEDPALSQALRTHAREIQAGVERMNGLVLQLRRFHALAPGDTRVVALDAVVRDAVALFTAANRSGVKVTLDLGPTPPARLQPLGVQQVVINLVANAADAVDLETGEIVVRTRAEPGRAVLFVDDNGRGMSEEVQRRAFDPLFTTKAEGMGLGLHIVTRIVTAHGGDIALVSAPGKGTSFTIRFPADDASAAGAPAEATAPRLTPSSAARSP
jgi:signal transduction histidine kinase